MNTSLCHIFDALWRDYTTLNPQAERIHGLLKDRGEQVVNDHIAFRTFAHPAVGLDILARPFVDRGYKAVEAYSFEEKKLFARHYEHPDPAHPRIFISELLLEQCSPQLRSVADHLINTLPPNWTEDPLFVVSGRPWPTPRHGVYESLRRESEYAAWLSIFGYRANHFTVRVNDLKGFDSLSAFNAFLIQQGFVLNDRGGLIKGSPEEGLEQSSTLAEPIRVIFPDATREVPGCYYEFALRHKGSDGKLFGGFIARNANKIFESTDHIDAKTEQSQGTP